MPEEYGTTPPPGMALAQGVGRQPTFPPQATPSPPGMRAATEYGTQPPPGMLPAPGAIPAPAPPAQKPGFGASIGHMGAEIGAAMQQTSPVVRDLYGNLNYQPAGKGEIYEDDVPLPKGVTPGELIQTDQGYRFTDEAGQWREIDPSRHVVLNDPKTNKTMVFDRSEKTEERLGAAGRLVGLGALGTAPTRLPGGAGAARHVTPQTGLIRDFERVGVDPNIPALAQETIAGRQVGRAAQALRETPIMGLPIEAGIRKTLRQVTEATENVATKYGLSRASETAGAVVKRGIKGYTSRFQGKADRLADMIPIPRETMGRLDNTLAALAGPSLRFPTEPRLGTALTSPQLRKYLEILQPQVESIAAKTSPILDPTGRPIITEAARTVERGGQLSWGEIKEFRSSIGRMLNDKGLMRDIPEADLNALYAALSRDMEAIAETQGATRQWQRFNRFYKAGQENIKKNLREVFDAKSDEAAYAKIITAAREGGSGNLRRLRALRGSLRPDEWSEVSATTIRNMGNPTARSQDPLDLGFSSRVFINNYGKLRDPAKNILFNQAGRRELRESLDSLVKVATATQKVEQLGAGSPTYPLAIQGAILAGMATDPVTTTYTLIGGYVTSKLMMSPQFIRWWANTAKLKSAQDVPAHFARLSAIARNNPELAREIKGFSETVGKEIQGLSESSDPFGE